MAERRMFAKTIIDSDVFIDMPMSARLLYYDLAMRADDDGFVNSPKKIMRFVGASMDDMNVLVAKQFIIPFESGVVVIRHWRVHNYIRKDTYKETPYKVEKSLLGIDENNSYTLENECPSTIRGQLVHEPSTQDRLGKDRLGKDRLDEVRSDEVRLCKVRAGKVRSESVRACAREGLPPEIPENNSNENTKPTRHKYGTYKNVLLTDEDMNKLKSEFPDDWRNRIERLSDYIASSGKTYKNHLATIRVWAKKDKECETPKNSSENNKWCMDEESISLDELYGLEVTK